MEKLSVSKEFVLAAHKAACCEWKSKIESEFPVLFMPEYKEGQWIALKHGSGIILGRFYNRKHAYPNCIAIRVDGESDNSYNSCDIENCRLATKEEIEKHLIALAEKKGFKHGVKINSLVHNREMTINKTGYSIEYIDGVLDKLHFGVSQEDSCLCCVVYEKGVWATIIEEPKTYTFARNQCGDITEISFKADSEKEAWQNLDLITGFCASKYKLKSTN